MTDGQKTLSLDASEADLPERLSHYDDAQAALRAMLALDAGQLGCWEWDISTNCTTGDPFLAKLFDLDYAAQPWPTEHVFAAIHPDDLEAVQTELARALDGDGEFHMEFRELRTDPDTGADVVRWLGGRGRVTARADDGTALTMIGVTRDITPEKTAQEKLSMLAQEMDHRVKNAFAVIRSLINLGERADSDKKSFARTLKGQVQAMADAHAISAELGREDQTAEKPIPCLRVARAALAPWTDTATLSGEAPISVTIEGDEDAAVLPRDVSALAMLVYELATNAAKYGPLGAAGGSVRVETERDGPDSVILRWTETTTTPQFSRDAAQEAEKGVQSGFGSMLLQHCVSTLRGRLKRTLTESGLHIELRMPVLRRG